MSHYVTLLCVAIGGLGVVGGGLWRIAAALFNLSSTVKLLVYRVGQVEERLGLAPVPAARHHHPQRRPTTGGR